LIYHVLHTTRYDYDEPVTASYAKLHQLPGDVDGQRCLERSIITEPSSTHQRLHDDFHGNTTAVLEVLEPHTTLMVHSTSIVDTSARSVKFPASALAPWDTYTAAKLNDSELAAAEFAMDSPAITRGPRFASYAAPDFGPGVSLAAGVLALNHRIHSEFTFDAEATEVDTTLLESFERRRGVCQDFTHVMIACLRSIGLAACYVSGYLETIPPPGQERLTGADRTHAWVGVYCGGNTWVGVDPTNDQLAGPRYITTARGRDYGDVPPMKGVIFTNAETSTLTVSVDVAPTDR